MLIIDRREKEITDELKRHDIMLADPDTTLEFGDCVFQSRDDFFAGDRVAKIYDNPFGLVGGCSIAIERKHLSDLINCIHDKRLSGHQLRGIREGGFDFCFLFVEDEWRNTAQGAVEVFKYGKWRAARGADKPGSYQKIINFITSQELKGGVVVRRTYGPRETAQQWVDLWRWFNDKTWAQHRSHDQVYAPDPNDNRARGSKIRFNSVEATYCFKIAAQLPGVDAVIAERVANWFGSPQKMMQAGVGEWCGIKGIGKVTAELLVAVCQGKVKKGRK